jgi:hypothetical protein
MVNKERVVMRNVLSHNWSIICQMSSATVRLIPCVSATDSSTSTTTVGWATRLSCRKWPNSNENVLKFQRHLWNYLSIQLWRKILQIFVVFHSMRSTSVLSIINNTWAIESKDNHCDNDRMTEVASKVHTHNNWIANSSDSNCFHILIVIPAN